MQEKQNIGSLFNRIAPTYDFLNHLLSLNIDKWWRRKAVRFLKKKTVSGQCLDVAIGTADLSIELARQLPDLTITGIDLSTEMMRLGEKKVIEKGLQNRISFQETSALDMPFADATFDVVTCGFGIRNFSDLDRGLREMIRVLKEGGVMLVLEFSYPENKAVAWFYDLYFSRILPRIGRLLSKDKTAYSYLNRSVKNFLWGEPMCRHIKELSTRIRSVSRHPLTFGIATVYVVEL